MSASWLPAFFACTRLCSCDFRAVSVGACAAWFQHITARYTYTCAACSVGHKPPRVQDRVRPEVAKWARSWVGDFGHMDKDPG